MAKRTSTKRPRRKTKARATATDLASRRGSGTINAWEQDPADGNSPTGGQVIQRPVPTLNTRPLPTRITNPARAPAPRPHNPGTAEFRYWAAADALRRGSDYWGGVLDGVNWQPGGVLPVDLDMGVDLNAFYDRVGLRFFHGTAGGRRVFSGESPDVVCHELGHAVLDAFKPQLWDAASIEIAAFHESFGDMSALLCALQLASLRHAVLAGNGGILYRASRLSRLAEQLGWAIRQSSPGSVEPDCLRNAVNSFFYRDPDTLPTSAPANLLSSEPHSFSRVFTAAFFEGMSGMLAARPQQDEANLLTVSQDAGRILFEGIRGASVVPTFYSQVAAHMLSVAGIRFGAQNYQQALKSAFVRHGVLPPSAVAAVVQTARAAMAAAETAPERPTLPALPLSVSEYGLGVSTIMVHSASEPKRYNVAGAALAVGEVTAPAQDAAAKSFFEDLLRRGRVKTSTVGGAQAEIVRHAVSPQTHDTHTHELRREGGEIYLRRVRIACACGRC